MLGAGRLAAAVIIVNNGNIRGAGSSGGSDYQSDAGYGGTALYTRVPIKLANSGTLYGGGGGGGGSLAGPGGGAGGAGVVGGPGYGANPYGVGPPGTEYSGGAGYPANIQGEVAALQAPQVQMA